MKPRAVLALSAAVAPLGALLYVDPRGRALIAPASVDYRAR